MKFLLYFTVIIMLGFFIFLVAAFDPKTQEAEDIKMKPTEAFREVKNFEATEFGWDIRFN